MLLSSCYCPATISAYLDFATNDGAGSIQRSSQNLCSMTCLVPGVWSGREGHVDHTPQGELIMVKSLYAASLESRTI